MKNFAQLFLSLDETNKTNEKVKIIKSYLQQVSDDDKITVYRARKIQKFFSQPFFVAEIFTGSPGKYVSLEETIKGFTMVLNGELDDLPEQAFYLVGNIEEAMAKAETLK